MKNLLKVLMIAVLITGLASCNDVLDNAEPSTSISQQQALGNEAGINGVRVSMYDRFHFFFLSTQYFLAPSAMADELINRTGSTRFNGQVQNNQGSHVGNWGATYGLINDANLLINSIPEGALDDATRAQYRGEAFFVRAFAYHQLVRTMGYEPGMTPITGDGSNFDLGVIIRSTPTLDVPSANYRPRATVATVYDQIRSDLEQATTLLSANGTDNRTFATEAGAQALLARVELYARNYDAADAAATNAISNTTASLVESDGVASMFDETAGLNPEAIFVITTNPNTESQGVNSSLATYTSQQFAALVPTQDLMDLYDEDDARLGWYGPCFNELSGEDLQGCFATHPSIAGGLEELEISKWSAEPGQFADDYPFFRVSEMLLIQSEARLNSDGDALTPINTLRAARGISTLEDIDIEDILDERRREFAAEGHRFFDLKRLGRTIRKAPETGLPDVPFNDFRVLDNLPTGEVSLSEANAPADSVLVQNPGY